MKRFGNWWSLFPLKALRHSIRRSRISLNRRRQVEEEVSEEDEMLVEKCLEIIRQEKAGVYFNAAAAAAPRLHTRCSGG